MDGTKEKQVFFWQEPKCPVTGIEQRTETDRGDFPIQRIAPELGFSS
jgi:hypothetical protein